MLQDAPTELCKTNKFKKWLESISLPIVDRMEVNAHVESWKIYDKQILEVELELTKRTENNKNAVKITTIA
jgi:hypothetical protein